MDPLLQVAEDLLKAPNEMADDILLDAMRVEGFLCEDEIRLPGPTSIGEAIADKKDRIVFFPVDLDEPLFAGSAKPALFVGVRKRDLHSILIQEMSGVCIKRDLGEMVNFQNRLDIKIEAVTDDFDIDALPTAVLIEGREIGIDA